MAFKMNGFSGFKQAEPKTRKNIFGTETTVTRDPEGKKTKTKVKKSGKTKVVEKVGGKRKVTKTYNPEGYRTKKVKSGGKITKTIKRPDATAPVTTSTTRKSQVKRGVKGVLKTAGKMATGALIGAAALPGVIPAAVGTMGMGLAAEGVKKVAKKLKKK